MLHLGLSENEVDTMIKENPATLLGL
jgi:hypothetical protein